MRPPRRSILAVGVVVVLVIGGILLLQRGRSTPEPEMWLPSIQLPDSATVCLDDVSVDCASAAAERLGQPVAWLTPGQRDDRVGLYVANQQAFQEFVSDGTAITIYSNPRDPSPSWPVIGEVERGADRGEIRLDNRFEGLWLVSVEWSRDGYRFLLEVSSVSGDQASAVQEAELLFNRVRYAEPVT